MRRLAAAGDRAVGELRRLNPPADLALDDRRLVDGLRALAREDRRAAVSAGSLPATPRDDAIAIGRYLSAIKDPEKKGYWPRLRSHLVLPISESSSEVHARGGVPYMYP